MVNISSQDDLVSLKKAVEICIKILENPSVYKVLNHELEIGTSRTSADENVVSLDSGAKDDIAVQRVGISLIYQKK